MGNWTVTVPEAGTNLVTDPECTALAFYNANGSTVTVDTTYARFGYTCLKIVTNNAAANEGVFTDVSTNGIPVSVGTTYTLSKYLRGAGTVNLRITWQDSGGSTLSTTTGATITLANSGWTRYTLSGTAPASAAYAVAIAYTVTQQAATFYADGFQFEAKSYATTFMSGNQPGCRWNGLYNASTSTRDAQYRLGGHEVDIESTYGVKVTTVHGIGVPPIQNNTQSIALQPGAIYQSNKILPRTVDLIVSTQVNYGDAVTTLHTRRDNLISLLAPDQYRGAQPVRLGYTGANSSHTVYGDYRYDGGLEFTDLSGRNEKIPLRLLAVDPLLYDDDQGQAALDFTDSLSADFAFGRINGQWKKFGTGFNDDVLCFAIDYNSGRVYFGGLFTTANGVTVNGICYYDGTTFSPLGAATKGVTGGSVLAIAIAPNGDIWASGTFTAAGGSATKGLAKWAAVGTGAPSVFNTATTFTSINTIAIDKDYRIYIGGTFTVFMGVANASYIATSSDQGTNWTAITATVASGGTPLVSSIAIDIDGTSIYFGGNFTAIGGVANTAYIAKYNRTTITSLNSGLDAGVQNILVTPSGKLYIAGGTGYLYSWNGNALTNISLGLTNAIDILSYSDNKGVLYVGALVNLLAYNGYTGVSLDSEFSSVAPLHNYIIVDKNTDDLYLGIGVDSTQAAVSGLTTVTNSGSTIAYPVIIITGTTTAGASSTLKWLENQTAKQVMYFNLTIQSGETITIDLSPSKKSVTSNWRGRIYDNPLDNSDFANFHLLPGANTIACFMTGTTTGAAVIMNWKPLYLSVDGVV